MPAAAREPKRGAVTPAFRPTLWLLLAAALFARAFVPQGYMPERTAQSTIAVAICGSDGHWAIPLGDGDEAPDDENVAAEAPCAFAGLGAPALPPAPALGLQSISSAGDSYAGPVASSLHAEGARLLPPATGPPLPA